MISLATTLLVALLWQSSPQVSSAPIISREMDLNMTEHPITISSTLTSSTTEGSAGVGMTILMVVLVLLIVLVSCALGYILRGCFDPAFRKPPASSGLKTTDLEAGKNVTVANKMDAGATGDGQDNHMDGNQLPQEIDQEAAAEENGGRERSRSKSRMKVPTKMLKMSGKGVHSVTSTSKRRISSAKKMLTKRKSISVKDRRRSSGKQDRPLKSKQAIASGSKTKRGKASSGRIGIGKSIDKGPSGKISRGSAGKRKQSSKTEAEADRMGSKTKLYNEGVNYYNQILKSIHSVKSVSQYFAQ